MLHVMFSRYPVSLTCSACQAAVTLLMSMDGYAFLIDSTVVLAAPSRLALAQTMLKTSVEL
eukprot:CAMPEP_0202105110 /NCGR_PEP_ID=MMETSP0965-20130614/5852_1 /ASSEMBLY_ACC=CAM_ASM_000507 /TAXON_ID=4773 /ORGANISM="Schizochytrium aggregatum, Strain ATCC28209" /LENGTH=60 /DNA_ID=CAMNT_0048673999 /DNA_START=106 /DNA_END=284 /DNA_ORIENTATION=-